MRNAPAAKNNESAEDQGQNITLTPREARLLSALLQAPVSREKADSICHASNSPDVVFTLRTHGVPIQTEYVPCLSHDGRKSHYGLYWLRHADKPAVREVLEASK